MKKIYNLGDDLFLVVAFVTFAIGVVLKLLGFTNIIWGVSPAQIIKLSGICLLFSIALSLHDLAADIKK